MIGLIIGIHVVACLLLIAIILVQTGRGGGLVDSFQGIESMFGTKTNTFLTRSTSVLATLFIITCLSLAVLSARQSKSLLRNIKTVPEAISNQETAAPAATVSGEQAASAKETTAEEAVVGQAPGQPAAGQEEPEQGMIIEKRSPKEAPAQKAPVKNTPKAQ